jgi:hypothetical protein
MPLRNLIIILLAAAALSGCGRRGGLEDPSAPPAVGTPAPAGAGISPLDPGAPAIIQEPAAEPAPKRRFFLDFLL